MKFPRRKRLILVVAGVAVLAVAGGLTPGLLHQPAQASEAQVTVCLSSRLAPYVGVTTRLPARLVPKTIETTASYEGRCASFGTPSPLGDGTVRTYGQFADNDKPVAIGVVFPSSMLADLPTAMTDQHHCYDVNGDGVIDPNSMIECVGGFERPLTFPSALTSRPDIPVQWTLLNWNSHGHGLPGIYDVPHFDFHFFIQSKAERDAIRSGPCGVAVNCDDYETGKKDVPPAYMPQDYNNLAFVEAAMGNHLIDQTSPEWNGVKFTRTFIYGSYDSKISFLEPMITIKWFQDLQAGTNTNGCFPIKQPSAWQKPGWYPLNYCIRYRANRNDFTVSLEDFQRH